jgi:excisionase family DNA binding protein
MMTESDMWYRPGQFSLEESRRSRLELANVSAGVNDMAELMTVEAPSKYLRLTKRTLYRLLRQGNIPWIKVGYRWRFGREATDSWFDPAATRGYGHVLVVDDDPTIGMPYATTLEERGYSVIALQTADEAMELVQRTNSGEIFVDLEMPKTKGAEILRCIRALQPETPPGQDDGLGLKFGASQ